VSGVKTIKHRMENIMGNALIALYLLVSGISLYIIYLLVSDVINNIVDNYKLKESMKND